MRKLIVVAVLSAGIAPVSAFAATVLGNSSTVTSLGSFAAGTYNITASGIVSLTDQPGLFDVNPNGTPVNPLPPPYTYCNPTGCGVDIPAGNLSGPAGPSVNLGALVGTTSANPTSPSDFFLIGTGRTFTLASPGIIYGLVNDTFNPNNSGSFQVNVMAVPEPLTWTLMLVGFAAISFALRRQRQKTQIRFVF